MIPVFGDCDQASGDIIQASEYVTVHYVNTGPCALSAYCRVEVYKQENLQHYKIIK
jgi:hypothetical protein